jgi:hypothetical protein
MRLSSRQLAVLFAVAALAAPAAAVDLLLSGRAETVWDSNVFGTVTDPDDDFALRFTPRVMFDDREGKLTWNLRYAPYYLYYLTEGEATGWSHDVSAALGWRITPTLQLNLNERFSRVDSLSLFFADQPPDVVTPDVPDSQFRTRRTKRNTVDAVLVWQPDAGQTVDLALNHAWYDYGEEVPTRTETEVMRASLRFLQRVTPRHQLGGGVAVSESTLRGLDTESRTRFYNLFGSWQWVIDQGTVLSVTAGPALVEPEPPDDPPTEIEDFPEFPLRIEAGRVRFVDVTTCPTDDQGTPLASTDCETIKEGSLIGSNPGAPVPVILSEDEITDFATRTVTLPLLGEVPDVSQASLTYFADVRLTKRWERWTASLTYRRQEASSSSSLGSSTVADEFNASLRWTPRPRWQVTFSGTFIRREQESDFLANQLELAGGSVVLGCPSGLTVIPTNPAFCLGPGGVRTQQRPLALSNVATNSGVRLVSSNRTLREDFWIASARVSYQFTRNFLANANFVYRTNERTGDILVGPSSDRYLVSVGFEYRFDPIHL